MTLDELFDVQFFLQDSRLLKLCSNDIERAERGLAGRNVTVAFEQLGVEFFTARNDILRELESCGFARIAVHECGSASDSARVSCGTFRIFLPELECHECDAAVFYGKFRIDCGVEQLAQAIFFFGGCCGWIMKGDNVNSAFFKGNRQVACTIDDEFNIRFRAVCDDTQIAEFASERHHGAIG